MTGGAAWQCSCSTGIPQRMGPWSLEVYGVWRSPRSLTVSSPPHPAHGLSCGRGVEALVRAMLDGHHALYQGGRRLEERGMVALLQPGFTRAARNDDRLGPILAALLAANLNTVCGA